jgi:hypothetical protein
MGQVDMESLDRGFGLTLGDVGHLLRPPGHVFEPESVTLCKNDKTTETSETYASM